VGYQAGYSNSTSQGNTLIGYQAGYATTGELNTFVGKSSGAANTSGNYNVALGWLSGNALTTGINNTFIGTGAASAVTTGSKNTVIGNYNGSAAPISATGSNYIVLSDGDGNVRQTIDSSGNVGMGTTSPSTYANGYGPVLVTGSSPNWATIQGRTDGPSGVSNGASYGGSYSTNPINGARIFFGATGTSGQQGVILFYTKGLDNNSTQPLERMRIDNNGLVAVNTTTPNASANVTVKQGTSGYQLQLEQSNATDGYGLRCNSADGDLTFSRYASSAYREDMRLQNTSGRHNGRLLIGAVANRSGESKLEIVGPSSTPLSIYMLKTAQVEVNLGFGDGGDSNFYINSGSTTIGTSGVFLTNAGNSWNSVSDERMKTIVEPIENASAKLATLRTVIGYFNNDTTQTRKPFLIAQDVQAVLPEAVNVQNPETGTLGMSYTDTIPLLVAAINELKAEFDAYKSTHP
jgi:hypothetical protein